MEYSRTPPQRPPWGQNKVAVVEVVVSGGSTVNLS